MDDLDLTKYEKLGPFEIKDFLAKVASKSALESSISYLNAGRGNPNWVATEPREAFFLLGQFAVTESKRGSASTTTCRVRPSCSGWCRGL
jgi:aspartate 4-decarboxylase